MGLFGPKRVTCAAGRWTTIISTSFAQMPKQFDVRFEGDAAGEAEVKKSSWIFPGTPTTVPLAAKMAFERGYWNTFYRVRVHPKSDVTAVIE